MLKSPEVSLKQKVLRTVGALATLYAISPSQPVSAEIDEGSGDYSETGKVDEPTNEIEVEAEYPQCGTPKRDLRNHTFWVTKMKIGGQTFYDEVQFGPLSEQCGNGRMQQRHITRQTFETICPQGTQGPFWDVSTSQGVTIESKPVHPDVLSYLNTFKNFINGEIEGEAILNCKTVSGRLIPVEQITFKTDLKDFTPAEKLLEDARQQKLPANSVYNAPRNLLDLQNGGYMEVLATARCGERYEGALWVYTDSFAPTAIMSPLDLTIDTRNLIQDKGSLQQIVISRLITSQQEVTDLYSTTLSQGLLKQFSPSTGEVLYLTNGDLVTGHGVIVSVYQAEKDPSSGSIQRKELLSRSTIRIICP